MAHSIGEGGINRNWYLAQHVLSGQRRHTHSGETRRALAHLILHSHSKASPVNLDDSQLLGLQTSPCFPEEGVGYHRVTKNPLLEKVDKAYSQKLELKQLRVISNPLLMEVVEREFPHPGLNLHVRSMEEFEALIDSILKGRGLEYNLFLNISQLIEDTPGLKKLVESLEDSVIRKLHQCFGAQLQAKESLIAAKFLRHFHLIGFKEYQKQHVLLIPEFFVNIHKRFDPVINSLIQSPLIRSHHIGVCATLDNMISRNGYRISPAEAKLAWLEVHSLESILGQLQIDGTSAEESPAPQVCRNFEVFLSQRVVEQFRELSQEQDTAPYLRVMPEATLRLLQGLAKYDIEEKFAAKGLSDLLQISYFRMANAMREAIFVKSDLVKFVNEIEVIHQEIQNILALLEPYDASAFSIGVVKRLREGESPTIPREIDGVNGYLKASGMHGFSSILASIEAQKDSKNLNVVVLDSSYYHASNKNLKLARAYNLFVLGEEVGFDKVIDKPIDVYVTEFHHNIINSKRVYRPVHVLEHIKELYSKGLMAKSVTIVIDTTIDLEKSEDLAGLLSDPTLLQRIREGKLNIVILRSAQKFDMLGMDNYYGGIVISINQQEAFKKFNERMGTKVDQLIGLDYQGLTHVLQSEEEMLDCYRKEIMDNAHKMYEKIPKKAIYQEGSENPLQISRIEDDKMFFLDIKFPHYPESKRAFCVLLRQFAQDKHLFFTMRASFGFVNTNLTILDGENLRFSPGLESECVLDQYAAFFHSIQREIDSVANITDESLAVRFLSLRAS